MTISFTFPEIFHAGICDTLKEKPFQHLTVSKPRTLTHYELEFFVDGNGVSHVNGQSYPIRKGNVLFACPGDVRYSHLHFCCKFVHFNITDESFARAVESIPKVSPAYSFNRMDSLFSSIISFSRTANTLEKIAAAGKLSDILCKLNTCTDLNTSPIADAQCFIEENYSENITIDSIAASANISPSYLYRIFKNSTGITVGEYLTDCRISAAKYLLSTTSLSVGEIATRCGFNSQSYFSDNFKKITGCTPLEFRRNWENRE